ncbi:MAG: hypothetical protein AVO34_02060 [Firmicutes bacterium ML8_F2]|jgi:hypothetical protein|nr:MAG: hypothetical protein AVO34_02060 [Firmicutes bacterium ML8_F2]
MNESRAIKILISASLILLAAGAFMFFQKGWLADVSLSSVSNSLGLDKKLSILEIIPEVAGFKGEKTYLLLFQNSLEIRPSGGYLGNFGILKLKNGQPTFFEIHDTNIFDGFGKVQTEPPQPIKDYLKVDNWQMRDANWSPDWSVSAKQIEYFYQLQGGQEEFDGIIAINAVILPDLLELIGPVYLAEFNKEFKAENVLYELEYEVEKGYIQRGIAAGERKSIFKALVKEVLKEISQKSFWEQSALKDFTIDELNKKNFLVFFKDAELQETMIEFGWAGLVESSETGDYLMLNEANLASRKSNAFIERRVEYYIDLTGARPLVNLKIRFIHQGEDKDWFNDDYRTYLRIYAPKGSWLLETKGMERETDFLDELDKTVFGNLVIVPTGQEKTVEFSYLLPACIATPSVAGEPASVLGKSGNYKILVQKQPGINSFPFKLVLKDIRQKVYLKEKVIERDYWEEILIRK